ncbi:MAG: cytochrome c [Acidobacteria bacterium]|nr:cytochrome c [Acidobacteriota bacterium]
MRKMKSLILFVAVCVCSYAYNLHMSVSGKTASEKDKGAITFTKQIAPIFQNRCEECHRQGGVAPMPLATYEEVRPWARAICEKVISREMPPFHAVGPIGRYRDDPRLTEDEITMITRWVDDGSPKGLLKDMPPPREWKSKWAHGDPDLIVKVKQPYTVSASDKDQYVFFVFDYVFPEDTWIRAVDTRPGNYKVVHHANTHVVPPMFKAPAEGFITGDFELGARGIVMLAGWAPGVQSVLLAEGTGVKIPKGMRLGIQIHYAPTGQESTDQTSVGIYFADGLIKKHIKILFGDRRDLEIPAGDPNYTLTATKTLETDALIRFFHVHMHLRGKSYVMKLTYPDGKQEVALEVPRYNFNWQRTYLLTEPLRVPKGTKVEFTGTYDNSPKNKFNPDPSKTIGWGEKTTDEMMQGRIFYEAVDENLNVKVKKGIAIRGTDTANKEK